MLSLPRKMNESKKAKQILEYYYAGTKVEELSQ
jgi:hypothetical protein